MAIFIDVDHWMDKHARRLAAMGVANPGYESIDLRKRRIALRAREINRLYSENERLKKMAKLVKLYLVTGNPKERQSLVNQLIDTMPDIR